MTAGSPLSWAHCIPAVLSSGAEGEGVSVWGLLSPAPNSLLCLHRLQDCSKPWHEGPARVGSRKGEPMPTSSSVPWLLSPSPRSLSFDFPHLLRAERKPGKTSSFTSSFSYTVSSPLLSSKSTALARCWPQQTPGSWSGLFPAAASYQVKYLVALAYYRSSPVAFWPSHSMYKKSEACPTGWSSHPVRYWQTTHRSPD